MENQGFSFGILWKEATKAVEASWQGIADIIFLKQHTEQNRDSELNQTSRSFARNSMFNSAMPVILLIVVAIIIFISKKS
ncbi:MAG: hypothetical protein LBB53_01080 [Prevotellaceae bacterium]|jgi:hypothetical protein|nr:hypothetical protein [Prevotellaceae bacterium]